MREAGRRVARSTHESHQKAICLCAGRSLPQSPVKLLDVWPDSRGVGGGLGSGGQLIGGPPFGCLASG